MKTCPSEFIKFASDLAEIAGGIHRRYFRTNIIRDLKVDGSPVTHVDRETELIVRDMLERRYPEHGIIGEEYPPTNRESEFMWLIDPLDGTETFLAGIPTFGFMIALAHGGQLVLGLIDQPILRERWVGADGHGTTLNENLVRTRECKSLSQAILHTDGPMLVQCAADEAVSRVCSACLKFSYGVDCYTYGVLASGFVDVVIDYGLDVYDFAALEPIVRNAGGVFTDWRGAPLRIDSEGAIIGASSLGLLNEVVDKLNW